MMFEARLFFNYDTALVLSEYKITNRPKIFTWKHSIANKHANNSIREMISASKDSNWDHENLKYSVPQQPPIPHSLEASTKISVSQRGSLLSRKSNEIPLFEVKIVFHKRRHIFISSEMQIRSFLLAPPAAFVKCARNGRPKGVTPAA